VSGLGDLLFASDRPAEEPAVHVGDEEVTRGRLVERADTVAAGLRALGVGPGRAVAVMLPDGADLVATLFGVWRAGAVYVPLNPRLSDPEVARTIATVGPAAVVTTDDRRSRFADLPVALVDDGRVTPVPDPSDPSPVPEVRAYAPGVALIQFTSGTTGEPKAVLLEHDGVRSLMEGVVAKIRGARTRGAGTRGAGPSPGRTDGAPPMPNLVPVSLSLWAGIYNVLFAFLVGSSVVLMDGFDPMTFAGLVRRFGIRSTVLPPAAMTMLTDDERITSLEPLRYVRSITSPLSPLQARRFKERFGIAVLNSYGQTEIGGEIVGWSAADSRRFGEAKLGSVGRPHEGVEVRAVDADGRPLPADETGEIRVRTPALAAGYADGRDLGDRLTDDGWFRTGDVGRVDADGFLWIEGRVSDMINRGGMKVQPGEVEEVLRLAPGVADAAVVGVPDERLGEVPWAFVVPAPPLDPAALDPAALDPAALDPAALETVCREHLAPYKVPVRFEAIDALPRNEVGKVLHRELVGRARPT
jgi:long-chain acyl-CoA synthetase